MLFSLTYFSQNQGWYGSSNHQMTWKLFCKSFKLHIIHSNCILFTPQYWNCTLASHTFPVYNQTQLHLVSVKSSYLWIGKEWCICYAFFEFPLNFGPEKWYHMPRLKSLKIDNLFSFFFKKTGMEPRNLS